MRRTTMRLFALACTTLALLLPGAANAATINMIVGNFDVSFDGVNGELNDFNRPAGGNLNQTEARGVTSVEIEVDEVTQVLLMDPPDKLFADLLINNLPNELQYNSLQTNQGGNDSFAFGFDFFDQSGNSLRLEIDDISYVLVRTGISNLNFFNFFASAKVISQSLPNGIQYEEDVLLSYTATDVMVFNGQNGGASTVVASGALTITGQQVPEPTTGLLLLGSLATSAVALRWKLG